MLEEGEDVFSQTSLSRWEKQKELPHSRAKVLVHKYTIQSIYEFSQKLNLSEVQIRNMTRMIRDFGLYEINRETLYQLVQKHFSLPQEQKTQIFQFIQDVFTKPLPSPPQESSGKTSSEEISSQNKPTNPSSEKRGYSIAPPENPNHRELPLLEALSRFPKLSGQNITPGDLTMKGSTQPVKPTIKNWITIYQQEMGPAPHEPFERSNFLFHNPNALRLSKQSRDDLNEILKSLDEKTPLTLDILEQKIIFPKISHHQKEEVHSPENNTFSPEKETDPQMPPQENEKEESVLSKKPEESSPPQNQTPHSFAKNISFSSSHQFPNEEK
jgi:hypothetical protein